MIRARVAYAVSRYASTGFAGDSGHQQIYSEGEISEDIELGARIHASGAKSVFINEHLCTGEARLRSLCFATAVSACTQACVLFVVRHMCSGAQRPAAPLLISVCAAP